MSRPLIFVLVAILALFSAYLLWPDDGGQDLDLAVQETEETQDPVAEAAVEEASAEIDDEVAQTAPVRTERTDIEPDLAGRIQPAVEGADGITVRTIDESSGEALPNTDIFALYPSDYDEAELEAKFRVENMSLEQICMEYGTHYRTNEEGITAVRRPTDRSAVLFARHQKQTTLSFDLDPTAEEWVVRLKPDLAVQVRVTDAGGNVAEGVPVSLRSRTNSYQFDLMTQRSNAEGIVDFENLNVFLQDGIGPSGDLYLGLAMLLPVEASSLPAHEQPLPTDEPPQQPIELQLPDHGGIKIRLVNDDGDLVAEDCYASLSRVSEDSEPGQLQNSELRLSIKQGEVLAPFVALNANLSLMVATQSGMLGEAKMITGPQRPGEVVEVDYLVSDRCTVIGTLTYEDGSPAANIKIDGRTRTNYGDRNEENRLRIRTNDDGRFELQFVGDALQKPADSRSLVLAQHRPNLPSLHYSLELPATLPRGELDLGSLKLQQMPLAVGGRVLDENGKGIGGTMIRLEYKVTMTEHDYSYWTSVQGGQNFSDAEGNYRVYASVAEQELRIRAEATGFKEATVPVQKGQENVVIQMQRGARLEGKIWLDSTVQAHQFEFRAEVSAPDNPHSTRYHECQLTAIPGEPEAYSYSVQDLADGTATLVLLGPDNQSILRHPDVALQGGVNCTPADWRELDLRGRLKLIELRLMDSHGNPVQSSANAFLNNGQNSSSKNGEISLYLLDEAPRIHVVAEGYAVVELTRVSQSQDVILQPGPEIQLRLPTDLALREGYTIYAQLYPQMDPVEAERIEESEWRMTRYSSQNKTKFGSDGLANLRVAAPGKYWLNLLVEVRKPDSRSISTHSVGHSSRIEVVEQAGVQIFDVETSREDLEKYLKN